MRRPLRLFVLAAVPLIQLGLAGCARAPAVPEPGSRTVVSAPDAVTGDAAEIPVLAGIDPALAELIAYHASATGLYDVAPDTTLGYFLPGYVNRYIFEEPRRYGADAFSTAAYHDWGGFPVYYPRPYTIGSSASCTLWRGGYGSRSRAYSPCGSFGRRASSASSSSAASRRVAANYQQGGPVVGQPNMADRYAADDAGLSRRPEDGWQRRLGGGASADEAASGSSRYPSSSYTKASGGSRSASGAARQRTYSRGVRSSKLPVRGRKGWTSRIR